MQEARRGSHWKVPAGGSLRLRQLVRLRVADKSKCLFFFPVILGPEAAEALVSLSKCMLGWKPMFFIEVGLF